MEKFNESLGQYLGPKYVLETAGTPCQDLSSANATRSGLDGHRSRLLYMLEEKKTIYKAAVPGIQKQRLLENVASMNEEASGIINHMSSLPCKNCPSGKFLVRRPRLFWTLVNASSGRGGAETRRQVGDTGTERPSTEREKISPRPLESGAEVQGLPMLHAGHSPSKATANLPPRKGLLPNMFYTVFDNQ